MTKGSNITKEMAVGIIRKKHQKYIDAALAHKDRVDAIERMTELKVKKAEEGNFRKNGENTK